MAVRTLLAIPAASLLALALSIPCQARGGFGGGVGIHGGGLGRIPQFGSIPPIAGGLPGTSLRPFGRGFSRGRFGGRYGRYGYGEGSWPWWGPYYVDLDEDPYVQQGLQPPVVIVREEPEVPAHVVEPKLIEVPAAIQKTAPQPSLPTVLVWRNGQREEVKEYTISGSYLYDYSKPRAARRLSLDDLDLDATERANQQRGVQFLIPASPSEVSVRF